jgi:hypothetical protein
VHRIQVFRRGEEGHAFLCSEHFHRDASYYDENMMEAGTPNRDGVKCSVEYETMRVTAKGRIELIQNGYIPTHDSTVTHEFKSPIMHGLNGLSKHCETYERLIANGDINLDESCGTHFNVSIADMDSGALTPRGYIGRFVNSLFVPLAEYLTAHPEECRAVFGRPLNYWAQAITATSRPDTHTNFINLEHSTHIEYRVCKFVNAKQYMTAAKLCVAMTKCINENFVKHFKDTPADTRRYPTETAYRKHKAEVTAKKLVGLFKKALAS